MLYEDRNYCMEIFLPKNPNPEIFRSDDYTDIEPDNFKIVKVNTHIPKFTHRKKVDLVPVLKSLGLSDMFNPVNADFSKISNEGAFVSKMVHEAVVIVNEKRTTAAAATVAIMNSRGAAPIEKIIEFRADHTFVYKIRHLPSKLDLFVGVFEN